MANDSPPQPRYLTLTELLFHLALFSGIGYQVGRVIGAWCGVGLVAILYAQAIWRSATAPGPASDPVATANQDASGDSTGSVHHSHGD